MDMSNLSTLTFSDVEKFLQLSSGGNLPSFFATSAPQNSSSESNSPTSSMEDSQEDLLSHAQSHSNKKRKNSNEREDVEELNSLKDRKVSPVNDGEHSHNQEDKGEEAPFFDLISTDH
jgi:hypothetical protein